MVAPTGLRCSAPRFVALAGACGFAISLAACDGEVSAPVGGTAATGGTTQGSGGSGVGPSAGNAPVGPGNLTTASASVARRVSRTELMNIVRDVLQDDTGSAAQYLADDEYRPFDNDYSVQRASRALIESLEALAED